MSERKIDTDNPYEPPAFEEPRSNTSELSSEVAFLIVVLILASLAAVLGVVIDRPPMVTAGFVIALGAIGRLIILMVRHRRNRER